MSRWMEQFTNHAFQKVWVDLKEALDKSTIDDETITTSVKEFARLRKIIAYLDEMILSIDPELVPLDTWDKFNTQATPCLQKLNDYNSDKNIAHINQANAHADNLLTYVRPYMIIEGKVGKALQSSLKAYSETIDKYNDSFVNKSTKLVEYINGIKNEAQESYDNIHTTKDTIDIFDSELFGEDGTKGLQNKIRELVESFDSKYATLIEYYNTTLIDDEENQSTKKEISEAKESITLNQNKIETILEDVSEEVKNLEKFHVKIFGESNKDDDELPGVYQRNLMN